MLRYHQTFMSSSSKDVPVQPFQRFTLRGSILRREQDPSFEVSCVIGRRIYRVNRVRNVIVFMEY